MFDRFKKEKESKLTHKRLKAVVKYYPDLGIFKWRIATAARVEIGSIAGALKPSGYVTIDIDGQRYRAHRLAWFYVKGSWPEDQIDHKDTNRSNNKWANLRLADNQQNQANANTSKNNTSGYKGVYWNKQAKKWCAKINPNRKQVHLGFFEDAYEAHLAYVKAAEFYFKEFART